MINDTTKNRHGIYNSLNGEIVLELNSIQPECTYTLYHNNTFVKESSGACAYYDPDFRSVFKQEAHKNIDYQFLPKGHIYTNGREHKILQCCRNCFWREFSILKIFIPYEIERSITTASASQNFIIQITHFCFSFDFMPLHFFGLKGITPRGDGEIYFISDHIFTTAVLQMETTAKYDQQK
jgi:hypothetical protein